MSDSERGIIHKNIDTNSDNPAIEVVETVAALEEKDMHELATSWDCIDGVLEHIFSNPPSPEAQVEVKFSYEGYRITVEQNGSAKFVKTTEQR